MTQFLTIQNDTLKAQISPWGAALARLWVVGHDTSLVLGLPNAADYQNAPDYSGVVVGPVAGRISGAQVTINDVLWQMEANTPPDCLHSGSEAISNRLWRVGAHTDTSLTLIVDLPHGACGLPGNRQISANYVLDGDTLIVTLSSTSDADTLINTTLHAYWSLDDAADLGTHQLRVDTARMCETGPDLIPTGAIVDQTGKDHDFTTAKSPIAGAPLDGCFCLDPSEKLRTVAWLSSQRSGIALSVATDQPGLVLYTGQFLTPSDPPPRTPRSAPFSAIAIEAQGWPDAPNHRNFPLISLKKGSHVRQRTHFTVTRS